MDIARIYPELEWAIFYGDGGLYTSHDGTWKEAPAWNVQVIAQPSTLVGRQLLARKDYYLQHQGQWLELDDMGAIDYLVNVFHFAAVHHTGAPTVFVLTKSGQLLDWPGLRLKAASAGILKIGRMLPDEQFRTLYAQALQVQGMPKKNAWFSGEVRL